MVKMARKILSFLAISICVSLLASGGLMAQPRPTGSAQKQERPPQPQAPPSAVVTAQPAAPIDSSYLLGPGDILELNLVGRADFGSRARISPDGTILLPMIGVVPAGDRTVSELADQVRQALIKGQFYSDPVVRVEVVGISSRYATVLGAVGAPGLLPLDRNYRLSEVLAKIGGRNGAGADYILVTHAAGGPTERYYIAKLASGTPDQDPIVKSGDKIFIPTAEAEVFYISGQVNRPGSYPVTEGLTVRRALAEGGGVTENGSEKKFKIVRDGKPLKSVKLEDPVKPGDILTFGERLF
jgi:polysaccharide export outer membrane protein